MKRRMGFVSNSSSSSFVIMKAGQKTLIEEGDTDLEVCGSFTMPIDELIDELVAAKYLGEKFVTITHGGGYEG